MRVSSLFVILACGRSLETDAYDPIKLLCTHNGTVQSWCSDWVSCIKAKAAPEGVSKVKDAWSPAECKEVCGVYPRTTPGEGQSFLSIVGSDPERASCLSSCGNFQTSLSTCVGKILFEPGQVASMQQKESAIPPEEVCTQKETPCLPELAIQHQRCVISKSKKLLKPSHEHDADKCKKINSDYDECKTCPQMTASGGSQYTQFVGGCIDQLNAYWQATHPAAKQAAIPGATGCKVHS
mmetsp:Transcript_38771/g.81773  ORF Transcript_38771/g.81773 Transcript_38771/m.81773 type:complete len:238 (+) Transcript_38771:130-843(+)